MNTDRTCYFTFETAPLQHFAGIKPLHAKQSMSKVTPYGTQASKKEQVTDMFDNIAPKYDLLNRVLSMGIDVQWRKKLVQQATIQAPKCVLDIATGTGDVALMIAKKNRATQVTGLDISAQMLALARKKASRSHLTSNTTFINGDSENLPFPDNSFDTVTVAFGVRNFEDIEAGLSECRRVLKSGGTMAVLEFSQPQSTPFKQIYNLYFRYVLPLIGRLTSKDPKAYTYLFESVQTFPQGQAFMELLHRTGFSMGSFKPLTFGICTLYWSTK